MHLCIVYRQTCIDTRRHGGTLYTNLNIVDVDLFVFTELERALAIFLGEVVGLVDFGILGKFTVSFHCKRHVVRCNISSEKGRTISSFISGVFDDDICLVILEVTKRKENDISLVYPNLMIKRLYQPTTGYN